MNNITRIFSFILHFNKFYLLFCIKIWPTRHSIGGAIPGKLLPEKCFFVQFAWGRNTIKYY